MPSLLKEIFEVIAKEDLEREAKYKDQEYRHYPSSASVALPDGVVGKCLRALFYRATKVPMTNPPTQAKKLMFGAGDAIHEWLFNKLKKGQNYRVVAEVPGQLVLKGLNHIISFRKDLEIHSDGPRFFGEMKTKQGRAISKLVFEGPQWADVAQIMCYLEEDKEVKNCNLICVARDTGTYVEFQISKFGDDAFTWEQIYPNQSKAELVPFKFEHIKDRFLKLEGYLAKATVPPRDFKAVLDKEGKVTYKRTKNKIDYVSDYQCTYCDWRDHCWSQPDAAEAAKYAAK